ncbi:MAG: IS110 family transposase [Nanoarchaeota archaeon]
MKYIGLDAHSSSCTFCVMDEHGVEIECVTLETNGRVLVDYIRSIEGKKKLAFEESELSGWLYEILSPEVDETIVCNPAANRDYKRNKNDKIDARRITKLLMGGFLSSVYHDGSERELFRSLMSGYQDLVQEAVRMKNRLKSLFRKSGKKVTGTKLYSDESFLEGLKRSDFRFIGKQTYHLLEEMDKSREEYLSEIKRCSRKFKEIKYLVSIPGIGEIQAAKIVAQVIDPRRFANKYKFYSYCGLVRHKRISGGELYGSVKIWGNRTLKCVYKMAGHSALTGNSGLKRYYDNLRSKGVSDKNAYNAVCRKIAAISLSVWKKERSYNDKLVTSDLIK